MVLLMCSKLYSMNLQQMMCSKDALLLRLMLHEFQQNISHAFLSIPTYQVIAFTSTTITTSTASYVDH